MNALKNIKYDSGDETISRRLVNGVRVIEKETHRIIKLVGGRYVDTSEKQEPRLVVVDEEPASFITRDRSSVTGLNAILNGLTQSPAISK